MNMNIENKFEPLKLKLKLFNDSLHMYTDQFAALISSTFFYEDMDYKDMGESIFLVQQLHDIIAFKIYREFDQKNILEIILKKNNQLVELVSFNLQTNIKREEGINVTTYTQDVKKTILICLSFVNAKKLEFKYDFLNEENKLKYKDIFNKLHVDY